MKTKSTILCLLLALSVSTNNAQVNVQDSLALVDLYKSTNGGAWFYNNGWLKSSVETWYGVTVTDTTVTKISLYGNNLNGGIPSSIGNLANLTDLNLGANHLSGSIPPSLGHLSKLQNLSLMYNELNESIPSDLGNLVSLQELALHSNQLSDTIPSSLGNLENLRNLSLMHNQLSGGIPSSLGNLLNLNKLVLHNNHLSGSIPPSLGNLVNLNYLDLSVNELSDSIPSSLGHLSNIEELGLSDNLLSGGIPASFGNLLNLKALILHDNQLSGTIPSSFAYLKRLFYLHLAFNQLSGEIPPSFETLVGLEFLQLNNNQLTGTIPASMGDHLKYLIELDLSNNQMTGFIPSSLGNLKDLSDLRLNNNQLSGFIPSSLGNLGDLEYLFLDNNQLSDTIPSSLGSLKSLYRLNLNDNRLKGNIPSLANLVNLYYLDVSNNRLSGSVPAFLSNLNLYYLDLSDNYFTFDGMELIAQTFPNAIYSPQANISVHQNGGALSVSAGGTLSNNTYKWFGIEQKDSITVIGDSVFHPAQSGNYHAAITNSTCTQLTLYTDTIFYDAALPVTMINLKAYQQGKINKIEWTSVTETNVDRYEIQRSSNAIDFVAIGSTKAKGNGTQRADYSFSDSKPLQGNNFYRLKTFDNDGKITYSSTVLVNISNDQPVTLVYPNPAKNILYIETNCCATFSLLDQSGKILLTENINSKGSINISSVSEGLYYLKSNSNGVVQKVVIAR